MPYGGYLPSILAGVALAAAIRTRTDDLAVRAILDITDDARPAADVAAGMAGVDRVLVVGAASDAIMARELALKIAEGARLPATMLDLETVLHGHLAAATRWTGLVLVLTDAADEPLVRDRAARLEAAARSLGIPVAAILSESAAGGASRRPDSRRLIVLPPPIGSPASPAASSPPRCPPAPHRAPGPRPPRRPRHARPRGPSQAAAHA